VYLACLPESPEYMLFVGMNACAQKLQTQQKLSMGTVSSIIATITALHCIG